MSFLVKILLSKHIECQCPRCFNIKFSDSHNGIWKHYDILFSGVKNKHCPDCILELASIERQPVLRKKVVTVV